MSTAKCVVVVRKMWKKNEFADSLFLLLIFHMSFFPCWIDFLWSDKNSILLSYDNGTEQDGRRKWQRTSHKHLTLCVCDGEQTENMVQVVCHSCERCEYIMPSLREKYSEKLPTLANEAWRKTAKEQINKSSKARKQKEKKKKQRFRKCERFSLSIVSNILSFKLQMIVLLNTKYIILGTLLGYCTSLNDSRNENGFADGDFMSLLHK